MQVLPVQKLHEEENKEAKDNNSLYSPMPCKITKIQVNEGAKVNKGDALLVLEAMKMEHILRASSSGTVRRIYGKEGQLIPEKKLLVEIDAMK